jgi:hypothetical protein
MILKQKTSVSPLKSNSEGSIRIEKTGAAEAASRNAETTSTVLQTEETTTAALPEVAADLDQHHSATHSPTDDVKLETSSDTDINEPKIETDDGSAGGHNGIHETINNIDIGGGVDAADDEEQGSDEIFECSMPALRSSTSMSEGNEAPVQHPQRRRRCSSAKP